MAHLPTDHESSSLRGASFRTPHNVRLVVGVWGDAVGQNWVVFSVLPHRRAASGLDGTGPFLALSQGLAGQDSGLR